ncbi:MAG: carboxypeptidase regulatory-like domain-containing protein [Planctomycetes bacterium]|nr:carboxypeptidase regulatory-like domain-containing protein [Planctomycetota bacterium]
MRWALGILASALIALAGWALWPNDPPPPLPATAPVAAPPRDVADARSAWTTRAAPRCPAPDGSFWLEHLTADTTSPTAAADDDVTAAVVRGRLTVRQRPWLHPAGVEIRLTRHWLDTVVPLEAPPTGAREPLAMTASDGSFAFRFHPGAGELFFLIDRGGAWLDFQKVPRIPAAGAELDLGEILVDERGGVRGRVLDASGDPLPGVAVRAVDSTLTDLASGLADLRAARTRGLEQFTADGATDWGPLPRWVARRDLLLPFPSTTSGADGRFDLRGLRPGAHGLIFRHDDGNGSLTDVQVAATRTTEVGDVALRAGGDVDLTFLDDAGLPWIDASVAFVHDQIGFGTVPVHTTANGRVHAKVVEPAATRVVFAYPGEGPCLDLGCLLAFRAHVLVPRLPDLTVTLADGAGSPLSGGQVRFFATGVQFRPVDQRLPAWMQPTERQPGLHTGKGLPGTIAVASVPGFAPAMARLGDGPNALTLLPLLRNTVRVHDREGRAIAGATVRLQVHEHPDLAFTGAQWELLASDRASVGRTDERGLLDIPVWGTWFSLEASHPDYAASAGPRFVPQPGALVELLLQRRAGIHGTLTSQHRTMPAGFRVRAQQRPPAGNVRDGNGFLAEQLAVTTADGTFAFRDLCPGVWELQPEFPATPGVHGAARPASTFRSLQVLLDEGQQLHCTLETSRAMLTVAQLAGIVRSNGAPMAGALVRVRALDTSPSKTRPTSGFRRRRSANTVALAATTPWLQQCTTDSFGDFDFAGLERDRDHEVRIDVPQNGRLQFLCRRVVRTPASDNSAPTPVDTDLATGSLILQCSQLGQPLANRMLRLRQVLGDGLDGACFELLTDDLGTAVADDLPVGAWTMAPMHGGNLAPAEFSIRARAITTAAATWQP